MKNAKIVLATVAIVATVITIASIGTATTVAYSSNASQESDVSVPRYADVCAHGHNGFDCKTPKYVSDIDDLKKRVYDLESDMQKILGPS